MLYIIYEFITRMYYDVNITEAGFNINAVKWLIRNKNACQEKTWFSVFLNASYRFLRNPE